MVKKKTTNNQQQMLSPENMIIRNGRKLPIYECFLSENIRDCGKGYAVVARKHTGGKLTVAFFLLDVYCCGVKNSFYKVRIDESEYEDLMNEFIIHGVEMISYEEVHNWIYGALEWANEAGIKPHKDFSITKFLLEEDTDEIPLIEYEFGRDGKHLLICDSYLEANKYLSVMEKNLSKDQFEVIVHDDEEEDDEDDKIEEDDEYDDMSIEEMRAKLDEMLKELDRGLDVKYTYAGIDYPDTLELENLSLMKIVDKSTSKITKKDLTEIKSLTSESLARDFRSIVLYNIGQIRNGSLDKETNFKYGEQISNVLILMGEYGDVESNLEVIFELMRQDKMMYDYVLGDCADVIIHPTLYSLAKDRLSVLKEYLLEPGLYTFFKVDALSVLTAIAYYDHSKRDDVLAIADYLLDVYTEKIEEKVICDGCTAAFLVSLFIDLGAKEFLPQIKKIHATNLVDNGVNGNMKEVEELLTDGEDHYTNCKLEFDSFKRFDMFKKWA